MLVIPESQVVDYRAIPYARALELIAKDISQVTNSPASFKAPVAENCSPNQLHQRLVVDSGPMRNFLYQQRFSGAMVGLSVVAYAASDLHRLLNYLLQCTGRRVDNSLQHEAPLLLDLTNIIAVGWHQTMTKHYQQLMQCELPECINDPLTTPSAKPTDQRADQPGLLLQATITVELAECAIDSYLLVEAASISRYLSLCQGESA